MPTDTTPSPERSRHENDQRPRVVELEPGTTGEKTPPDPELAAATRDRAADSQEGPPSLQGARLGPRTLLIAAVAVIALIAIVIGVA